MLSIFTLISSINIPSEINVINLLETNLMTNLMLLLFILYKLSLKYVCFNDYV